MSMGWRDLDLARASRGNESRLGASAVILGGLLFTALCLCSGPGARAVILGGLLLFSALSLWGLVYNVRGLLTWPAATGTVIGHDWDDKRQLITPVVEFQTHDGRTMRVRDGILTSWWRYSVGKQVRVRYDVQNPSRVIIGYHGTLIYGALLVWFLGFTLIMSMGWEDLGSHSPVAAIFGAVATIIALAMFVSLGRKFRLFGRLRGRGTSTIGTVIKHIPQEETVDRPVIQFADQQGRQFEFVPMGASFGRRFVPVGQQFSVVYLPDQPQNARVRSETNWRLLLPQLLGGLAFSVIGLHLMGVLPLAETGSIDLTGLPLLIRLLLLPLSVAPSLGILSYTGLKFGRLYTLHRNGLSTTGTVTRTIKTDDGSSISIGPFSFSNRLPVIDFFDSKNRRIQFISKRGPREIGATVPVVYLQDRPHKAMVAPPLRNIKSLLFPTFFGVVFFVFFSVPVLRHLVGH